MRLGKRGKVITAAASNLENLAEEDRISSLPDEMIGQILSLIPTKFAVATSCLSKRWNGLYKLVTCLNFDEQVIFMDLASENIQWKKRLASEFLKFVDSVMHACTLSHITRFTVKFRYVNEHHGVERAEKFVAGVEKWIQDTSCHGVREVDVAIHGFDQFRYDDRYDVLKLSLCSSTYLAVLKLEAFFTIHLPDAISFPNLKVLHLKKIKFSDVLLFNRLFASCPLLEELVLEGRLGSGGVYDISSSALRRLTLGLTSDFSRPLDDHDEMVCMDVIIDAPRLVYLDHSEDLADRSWPRPKYCIGDVGSLKEARINLSSSYTYRISKNVVRFLQGISCCQILCVSDSSFQALHYAGRVGSRLPLFYNLKRLELVCGNIAYWFSVPCKFFRSCPYLETLVFPMGLFSESGRDMGASFQFGEVWDHCVKSNLKVIDVKCVFCNARELNVLLHFLGFAQVLERIDLHLRPGTNEDQIWVFRQLLTGAHKASKSCLISFM